jgi:hypothetical protein
MFGWVIDIVSVAQALMSDSRELAGAERDQRPGGLLGQARYGLSRPVKRGQAGIRRVWSPERSVVVPFGGQNVIVAAESASMHTTAAEHCAQWPG